MMFVCQQQQRVKKMEQEAKFGSKPVTPSVKRVLPHTTPSKSTKMRKVCPLSIHSIFITQNSRGGLFTIGWQADAATCQTMWSRRLRDFRIKKEL